MTFEINKNTETKVIDIVGCRLKKARYIAEQLPF